MSKSIIIIGNGIAGLAAGCYAQMNGYRSQIFEMHKQPGGLCTAWERKEYIFDGCLHYLFGSGEGQPFNQIWHELGAVQGRKMINHEEFMRVKDYTGDLSGGGKELIAYVDPDRLAAHMKELSPVDSKLIDQFAEGIRQFMHFDLSLIQAKPRSLMTLSDYLNLMMKMAPFLEPLAHWGFLSAQEFADKFQDSFLRRAIPSLFGWPEIPMMAGLAMLAYTYTGNAAFPAGASLDFARAVEKRYIDLGGEIRYRAQVEKILVEEDRAVGIRLYSDEEYRADYIISAADGRNTIFEMLGGNYTNQKIKRMYDGHVPLYSQVQISLGVNRDFSHESHWVTYLLDKPILIAGEEHYNISVSHYCYDPSLAPAGKSVLIALLRSRYGYWQRIYGHQLYDTEQDQVSDIIIDFLETLYPGLRQDIEVIDEATPLSYERYTGNWQGSSCGWLLTKETMPLLVTGVSKQLPGLKNFYLAGQWVEPGGTVPLSANSGRNVMQLICHEDGKDFHTSLPE